MVKASQIARASALYSQLVLVLTARLVIGRKRVDNGYLKKNTIYEIVRLCKTVFAE